MAELTDKRMQELVDTLDCPDPDEVAAMIDEIRRRRAADLAGRPRCTNCACEADEVLCGQCNDLSDADREALRVARKITATALGVQIDGAPSMTALDLFKDTLAALDRLIGERDG